MNLSFITVATSSSQAIGQGEAGYNFDYILATCVHNDF